MWESLAVMASQIAIRKAHLGKLLGDGQYSHHGCCWHSGIVGLGSDNGSSIATSSTDSPVTVALWEVTIPQ